MIGDNSSSTDVGAIERTFGLRSIKASGNSPTCEDKGLLGGGWAVYELLSDSGELLYVGMSKCVGRRLASHESTKPWWPDVAEIRVRRFAFKKDAQSKEKMRILCGEPLHNKTFNLFGGAK